jgi:hypothetical protein
VFGPILRERLAKQVASFSVMGSLASDNASSADEPEQNQNYSDHEKNVNKPAHCD